MEKQSENQQRLKELLAKSPNEISHEEMMFVLEHMNLEDIFAQAVKRNNEKFINLSDEQKN